MPTSADTHRKGVLAAPGLEKSATAVPTVLLICVKYGADKETERYLNSLRALQSRDGLHVMVVDNSAVGTWGIPSGFDSELIQAPSNLGYFGGARYGLSLFLKSNPLPDWVVVSNVDLRMADPSFLERLAPLGSVLNLGAVAPSIRSSLTGNDQNPFMRVRPSVYRMHFYKWLSRNWLILNTYELLGFLFHRMRGSLARVRPNSSSLQSREKIYAPHGSFLILARTYFDRGGTLDFPQFLFGEEVYIAEQMRRLGLEVLYEPSLQVTHQEHQSTKLFKSRRVAQHVAHSAAYCADILFPTPTRN
jgi:GT2 family glycosyltransferase